jgi:hypothetical protein
MCALHRYKSIIIWLYRAFLKIIVTTFLVSPDAEAQAQSNIRINWTEVRNLKIVAKFFRQLELIAQSALQKDVLVGLGLLGILFC